MFQVLNMNLEVTRTVLKNAVNEITVCADLKRESGAYYTVIAVTDSGLRKELARRIGGEGLFSGNRDFIGSFTYQEGLNLVFDYRPEVRLCDREAILVKGFGDRKNLASSFLVACAETGTDGAIGELLIRDRNINVTPDGKVYFNYFIDFLEMKSDETPKKFFRTLSAYAFDVLTREYSLRYDRQIDRYPRELQAFFKKKEAGGFTGYNQILTFIKMIPDRPAERHFGLRGLLDWLLGLMGRLKKHSMAIFLTALVLMTVAYGAYEIFLRLSMRQSQRTNTSYSGMSQIGEVYLGDEEI